jgi:alpha-beta hydrolase superfamily lysophospholipase
MDIWGHGSSPGIPRGVAHVGKAVHDHVEVRRLAAAERLPIFLMGFSLGGLVTAASFVQEPTTNTKGIILMYPALPEAQSSFVRGILGFGSWIMPNASLPVKGVPYQDHTRDLVEVQLISEDPFMIKRALPFLLAKTALEEAEKVWAGLDTWNTSTLVMHGTADLATNPHTSEFFVSQITAGDKKLRLWEDCRHELLNDLSGRGVLAELLQWLRERTR